MKTIDEKDAQRIFEQRQPNDEGKIVDRSFSLYAEIDTTPQPLRKLRGYEGACLRIPMDMKVEAQIVLKLLLSCFEKQGHISEGKVEDIMWGYEQAMPPIPRMLTYKGLVFLWNDGYIKFQAPDNSFVEPQSSQISESWVRYTPKLLSMAYEDLGKI